MKLTLLGTGSPVPSLKRCSAGYMLEIGSDVVLIDVGPGTFMRLLQSGKSAGDVTHVLLSHLHFDHCLDFVRLFLHRWDMTGGLKPPIRLFGPPGLAHMVDRLFGPDGAFKVDLTARTNHPTSLKIYQSRGGTPPRPWPDTVVTEMRESDVIEGEGWTLRIANVPHHQPYLTCYGVRLESSDGVFAYTSDISLPPENGPAKPLYGLARDADVLVHYLNAFSFDRATGPSKQQVVAQLAHEANVKTLVTSHHGPAIDAADIRERVIADITAIYKGRFVWGEDLMTFDINRHSTPAVRSAG